MSTIDKNSRDAVRRAMDGHPDPVVSIKGAAIGSMLSVDQARRELKGLESEGLVEFKKVGGQLIWWESDEFDSGEMLEPPTASGSRTYDTKDSHDKNSIDPDEY